MRQQHVETDCKARIEREILHAKWWISRIFCSFLLGHSGVEGLPNFPSTQFKSCQSPEYSGKTLDTYIRLLRKNESFQKNLKKWNLTDSSLNLSHYLIIGDGLSCFIVCNYLWLLINFLKKTTIFISSLFWCIGSKVQSNCILVNAQKKPSLICFLKNMYDFLQEYLLWPGPSGLSLCFAGPAVWLCPPTGLLARDGAPPFLCPVWLCS